MKIVFDHQIFYSQRYGGISRYFRELSLHLARAADTRVAVVATFHINAYLRRNAVKSGTGPRLAVSAPVGASCNVLG